MNLRKTSHKAFKRHTRQAYGHNCIGADDAMQCDYEEGQDCAIMYRVNTTTSSKVRRVGAAILESIQFILAFVSHKGRLLTHLGD